MRPFKTYYELNAYKNNKDRFDKLITILVYLLPFTILLLILSIINLALSNDYLIEALS